MSERMLERIEREAGLPGLVDALAERVPRSDLHSVLLAVARRRASRLRPGDVLSRYETDRLVRPADVEPKEIDDVERRLLAELPSSFERIELSPVCPLGTSSVLGGVSQDWVVTSFRGGEVVSDPTNVLALECAVRRRSDRSGQVRLFASHRVLRAQPVAPSFSQHFALIGLCSAGRAGDEEELLNEHVGFFRRALEAVGARDVALDAMPRKREYYGGATFGLSIGSVEVVEGGFVDWTQRLLGDRKERLLISGLGVELVARIAGTTRR